MGNGSAGQRLRSAKESLLTRSLRAAAKEQELWDTACRLKELAGDLTDHYSSFRIDSDYLRTKVLCQHAFQAALAAGALGPEIRSVADVGDSSGLHTVYLKALRPELGADFVSVNLDAEAVARVRGRGLKSVRGRAEDLRSLGVRADVVLLFETLEHLHDPLSFLRGLAEGADCRRVVLTVPFVRASRVGLHHIRQGIRRPVTPERVHVFELSPPDLRLLFLHAGWGVAEERVYLQYPRRSLLRLTRGLWARWDFEGFYGAVLRRDDSWSCLYEGWKRT